MGELIPAEHIQRRIYLIRGRKVMLSTDLARLYGVRAKALIQAVKRNIDRFPGDFAFKLTVAEADFSRSQSVTLNRGQNIKHPPYAFTEQGVAMLSSVLRSKRAAQVNIAIMRAFVRLREILSSHRDLTERISKHERRLGTHDRHIQSLFEAIRQLTAHPAPPKRKIGFDPGAPET
ncbi:MAG: ORF6N domain-containing protein [Elusimicrobiota bacterium]